jgi:hypothetical protein
MKSPYCNFRFKGSGQITLIASDDYSCSLLSTCKNTIFIKLQDTSREHNLANNPSFIYLAYTGLASLPNLQAMWKLLSNTPTDKTAYFRHTGSKERQMYHLWLTYFQKKPAVWLRSNGGHYIQKAVGYLTVTRFASNNKLQIVCRTLRIVLSL